jgi:hypothetical protein
MFFSAFLDGSVYKISVKSRLRDHGRFAIIIMVCTLVDLQQDILAMIELETPSWQHELI